MNGIVILKQLKCGLASMALMAMMVIGSGAALASPLDDARSAGYIGELPNGYVALVDPNAPAEVKALVEQVNAQRRAKYEALAAEQGVPIEQVGAVTAEKLITQKLQPGWYYMDASGNWVQR